MALHPETTATTSATAYAEATRDAIYNFGIAVLIDALKAAVGRNGAWEVQRYLASPMPEIVEAACDISEAAQAKMLRLAAENLKAVRKLRRSQVRKKGGVG